MCDTEMAEVANRPVDGNKALGCKSGNIVESLDKIADLLIGITTLLQELVFLGTKEQS